MPTIKQRKLAKEIIENSAKDAPRNAGQMLAKVGYSRNLVKQPGRVIESVGVQEALEEYGFTEDNAKRVVAEILLNPKERGETRINAAKEVFKVRGAYAPEKSVNMNLTVSAEKQMQANDVLTKFLNGSARDTVR